MNKRCRQVANEIIHQLSEIINSELEMPLGCLATILHAEVSPDLKISKIFISVLPENKKGTVLKYLQKNSQLIRKKLGARIKFYTTPEVRFFIDEGEIKRREINQILDDLK